MRLPCESIAAPGAALVRQGGAASWRAARARREANATAWSADGLVISNGGEVAVAARPAALGGARKMSICASILAYPDFVLGLARDV
jgi:hypothetical protein